MQVRQEALSSQFSEWDFCEDEAGIVYCLGRNVNGYSHEAVAVYERAPDGNGAKTSLDTGAAYNRIMYHGFPEEQGRLAALRPETKEVLLGRMSLTDTCLYVDPRDMLHANTQNKSIDYWLGKSGTSSEPFRIALDIASTKIEEAGVRLDKAKLYGGASFGLIDASGKRVDDVDFLLDTDSQKLLDVVDQFTSPYGWGEIDPQGILSERRKMLKAKRWSTSQLRLYVPEFLSVDFKIERTPGTPSRWDSEPTAMNESFEGRLRVIDDSESFCISPTLLCEDMAGRSRTVLLRGYPYIGSAIMNDIVTVKGTTDVAADVIVVSQALGDVLVPDLNRVPIS